MRKQLPWQIGIIALVVVCFAGFNFCIYELLTKRLGNNFSGTDQMHMIEVGKYLPHEENSKLPQLEASLKLKDDLPVLDGAAALVPVYASFIHNVYPKGSVTYEDGVFSDDNYYGENFAADSKMQYRNTVRGFKALISGDCDVFFTAEPSEEQKQYAKDNGVELEYVPIGLEAFVFFVNEHNPVDGLTTEQVRDIYAGKITNWNQVGGVNRPINPVQRVAGSGSQTMMERFMGNLKFGPKTPLAAIGGSIGFSFRYYFETMVGNPEVKMLALNDIYPSAENIQNGTYPIIAKFYAVYRSDNKNENVKALIDWILSDEGQQIIEKCGYVRIK